MHQLEQHLEKLTNFHPAWVYAEYIETKEWIICHKVSMQGCIGNREDIPSRTQRLCST